MNGQGRFKSFSDIIGQDRAINFLKRVIVGEKIPHAYLFTGISGVGKTSTALALTQALNCNEPSQGEGCGQCRTCRRIINGTFTDLIFLEPEGDFIKIDQIRELSHSLCFKPAFGRYRVCIIDNAERMTEEAANSFLKILEEPPQGNVLVLKVTEPLDLLPTIVSRCQKIPFRPLPVTLIAEWLGTELNVGQEDSLLLAKISEGSLGRAIEVFESGMLEERRTIISEFIELPEMAPERALDMALDYSKMTGKDTSNKGGKRSGGIFELFGIWKTWLRDLIIFKEKALSDHLINIDFSHKLNRISQKYDIDGLIESFFIVDTAQRELIRNPNLNLLMENTLLNLKKLVRN